MLKAVLAKHGATLSALLKEEQRHHGMCMLKAEGTLVCACGLFRWPKNIESHSSPLYCTNSPLRGNSKRLAEQKLQTHSRVTSAIC